MKSLVLLVLTFASFELCAQSNTVDIDNLIARCSLCHSSAGLPGMAGWPAIAGMEKQLIIGKLKEHRAGIVEDSTMKKVASDLSDEDINAVAEYFSKLPIKK